jgi:hypothetical protein
MNRTQKDMLEAASAATWQNTDAQDVARIREWEPTVLLAKITSYSVMPSASYRWIYNWTLAEVSPTTVGNGYAFAPRPGENFYTGTALNVCEAMNSASFVGPGINPANIPAGFAVKPVEGFVLLYSQNRGIRQGSGGEPVWLFYAPNAIDGNC